MLYLTTTTVLRVYMCVRYSHNPYLFSRIFEKQSKSSLSSICSDKYSQHSVSNKDGFEYPFYTPCCAKPICASICKKYCFYYLLLKDSNFSIHLNKRVMNLQATLFSLRCPRCIFYLLAFSFPNFHQSP